MDINCGKTWELQHSTLYKNYNAQQKNSLIKRLIFNSLTFDKCKKYSQNSIVSNLTKVDNSQPIIEIFQDEEFCFMGRVDTSLGRCYNKHNYYQDFDSRNFISFSTITNENISHYANEKHSNIMFAYNVPAEAIVHVFPCDSNTWTKAETEEKLTQFPSLWLSLDELNEFTKELRVYNQITCKTKIDGKILKPSALIVFDDLTDEAKAIAEDFDVNIILIHTKKNVINYNDDLMKDSTNLKRVSRILYDKLNINFYYINSNDFF